MNKRSRSPISGIGSVGKITMGLVLPIFVGFFLGNYLDNEFGTNPLFTLALILLGIFSGFAWLYKTSKDSSND
ncbi:MAG: AtpZ/AtpI family protein [Candidatus Poribacteria bacterium]